MADSVLTTGGQKLEFPSSGKYVAAFILLVQRGDPGPVDLNWIKQRLAVTQTANAAGLRRWLIAAGLIADDGTLTSRALHLRDPSASEYRSAARAALESLAGTELLSAMRNSSTFDHSRSLVRAAFSVGASSASKALASWHVLAYAAGDGQLAAVTHQGRPVRGLDLIAPQPLPAKEVPDLEARPRETVQLPDGLELFAGGTGGLDSLLVGERAGFVLAQIRSASASHPLTCSQLNQCLVLAHQAPMSNAFFRYYWLTEPDTHPHPVRGFPGYQAISPAPGITSLEQFAWGMYRFYVDALLYFGNLRTAYQALRDLSWDGVTSFFAERSMPTDDLLARGPSLPIEPIPQDDRYLISEMACKTYQPQDSSKPELRAVLKDALRTKAGRAKIRELVDKDSALMQGKYAAYQYEFAFSVDELLDHEVSSESDIDAQLDTIIPRFSRAREVALRNTETYLSAVGDLDVYVATSMRTRQDFRDVTRLCDQVFGSSKLTSLGLRYFNPTLSAAQNHEDKGLIECLMVERARVLVYLSGIADSYGKDAEAAMALSLGKTVVFYCDQAHRERFARDGHPLSRLVDFATGVAVGALVANDFTTVIELLRRIFYRDMQYRLEQKQGFGGRSLMLKEQLTNSTVRLQTSDVLLRETFWNHYGLKRWGLEPRTR